VWVLGWYLHLAVVGLECGVDPRVWQALRLSARDVILRLARRLQLLQLPRQLAMQAARRGT
jgi:hypothetical protein